MRKINARFLVVLLVGSALLAGGVFAVHYFQYERIARAVLWQADHAAEQGKLRREVTYLRRYLEFNPRDLAAKERLARLLASETFPATAKERSGAVHLLDEVLNYRDDPEARRLLVKVALEVGNTKRAREHLDKLLSWKELEKDIRLAGSKAQPAGAAKEDPARGELEGYWGQLLQAERRPAREALGCFRLAVRHAPREEGNYVRLAYLLRRLNESEPERRQENSSEADRAVDSLVANNPHSYKAFLARWRYRREFDLLRIRDSGTKGQVKLADAAEDVAAALKRSPESVEALLAAADLERLRARQAVEDVSRPFAEREQALQRHRERALEHLRRGLELIAKQPPGPATEGNRFGLLWHKASLLLDDIERADSGEESARLRRLAKQEAEVRDAIEQVRKTQIPAAGEFLQGRLLIHQRRWAEAVTRLERAQKLLAPQPDLAAQANLYLGQCYERLDDYRQMYEAYKRVAEWDPGSVAAKLGMAAARWAQGRLDDAQTGYLGLMREKVVPARGWLDIARLEIQRQLQRDKPDWTQAEAALMTALAMNPRLVVDVAMLRAEVAMREGKPDQAEQILRKAKKSAAEAKDPRAADVWVALVDLALRGKGTPGEKERKARGLLEEATLERGDQAVLRVARARYLAGTQEKKAAGAITELARGRERFTQEDQARLLNGLADVQLGLGNLAEARGLWQELVKLPRYKHDLRLRLLLFDLALKEGDKAGIARALEDIRGVEPADGTYHLYGEALRLIWLARRNDPEVDRAKALSDARQRLDRVLERRANWPPVFLARAEIAELSGSPEEAVKELQEAVNQGDTSPGAVGRLCLLLAERGREGEAEFYLQRVRAGVRRQSEVGKVEVYLDVLRGRAGDAVGKAEKMVQEETKDPRQLVWVARVQAAAGKYSDAERNLNRAVSLAAGDPLPWVAKVQILVEGNKRELARRVIEQASPAIAPDRRPLALAQCYDLVGDTERALKWYDEALRAKPGDAAMMRSVAVAHLNANRLKEAEPLLRRIAEGGVKGATRQDVEWARRGLAIVLASGTDFRRFSEALGLVGLKLDERGHLAGDKDPSSGDSTERQRAKARVLAAQQGQGEFRRKAIEIFEELNRKKALTLDDLYVLALLYEAEGQESKARDKLGELVRASAQTPQYLAQYAMYLIVQKKSDADLAEAEKYIGMLEALEKQRKVGPNGFASVELRARVLEARGKGAQAVKLLERHTQRRGARPEEVLLVLASLSRQEKYAKAFALCENVWKEGKCNPEAVGAVSVALLRKMKPKDDQVAAVEEHLRAALKTRETPVLLMHLADLYDNRGRYDQAEEAYRKVLKVEPNNVVALNNLAWLLAVRAGKPEEALGHINKAVRGLGRRPDLLDTRGLVHLALKDTAKALDDLEEVAKEAPTPVRLFHLARAHHQRKDGRLAAKVLREAKEKGLDVASLHPIEQQTCRKLLDEYGVR